MTKRQRSKTSLSGTGKPEEPYVNPFHDTQPGPTTPPRKQPETLPPSSMLSDPNAHAANRHRTGWGR